MDVQTTVNESDEAFNGLGCIKSIIYHIGIGPNVLSEVHVPHKTQLSETEYKLNFTRWLNHLELIQTLLTGLIVWSLY